MQDTLTLDERLAARESSPYEPTRGSKAGGLRSRMHNAMGKVRRASFGPAAGDGTGGGTELEVAMGLEGHAKKAKVHREVRISRKDRNRLLGIAVVLLLLDAVIATVFCLLAPTDPRLATAHVSRRQLRTVYMQGFVALLDALVSIGILIHVVHGVVSASLDNFLEAAATKLLQAWNRAEELWGRACDCGRPFAARCLGQLSAKGRGWATASGSSESIP